MAAAKSPVRSNMPRISRVESNPSGPVGVGGVVVGGGGPKPTEPVENRPEPTRTFISKSSSFTRTPTRHIQQASKENMVTSSTSSILDVDMPEIIEVKTEPRVRTEIVPSGGSLGSASSLSPSSSSMRSSSSSLVAPVVLRANERLASSASVISTSMTKSSGQAAAVAPLTPNKGQRVPEKILGDIALNGERFFMIKWKNCITKDLGMFFFVFVFCLG